MRLTEFQITPVVRPTNNQRRVLAKIAAAPTSTVAAEEISGDQNMIAARDLLMKMGLITLVNGKAQMTNRGEQVAVDENIIDQSGQLTTVGKTLAYTGVHDQPDNDMQEEEDSWLQDVPVPPIDPAIGGSTVNPNVLWKEQFSLLKELLK